MMTYEEALKTIHSVSWMGTIPGLERTRELLRRIQDPQKALKFVHIAGTNGKGSTAAMIASVLKHAGYRTGLYTSPYILRFNERMQVNNIDISDEELAELTEWIKPHADAMQDHPSEFELITCIAFEYFRRHECEIVVLEVGMGGSWDSTNVIEAPEAAVFTNIGLDHTQVLGSTLTEIARTKAGILKDECPCVLYEQSAEVEQTILAAAEAGHCPVHRADYAMLTLRSSDLEGQTFDWKYLHGLRLPLLGEHQLHNACTALTTIETLWGSGWIIPEEAIFEGLRTVSWPGRFQVVRRSPMFIIDGGHNPQCLDALVKAFRDYLPDQKLVFLNGCMADKDYAAMFSALKPFAKAFVTVTPNNPRALPARELAEHLKRYKLPVTACETVADGVRTAVKQAGPSGIVCACGSLYMIGEIDAALKESEG